MTAAPPLEADATQETSAEAVLDSATTEVGASGTVDGVAAAGMDGDPAPMALSARTSTVYGVPLTSEPMLKGLERVPASIHSPPRRYFTAEIGEPPLSGTV